MSPLRPGEFLLAALATEEPAPPDSHPRRQKRSRCRFLHRPVVNGIASSTALGRAASNRRPGVAPSTPAGPGVGPSSTVSLYRHVSGADTGHLGWRSRAPASDVPLFRSIVGRR